MDEVIREGGRYYILAESSLADEETHRLKHGHTFAIFNKHGDIRPLRIENHGVYHQGTRFLSHLDLSIDNKAPLLLSSTVKENNDFLTVGLTNPELHTGTGAPIHSGTLFLNRTVFLWRGVCYERVRMANYGRAPIRFSLAFTYDADFVDIFEVRGTVRKRRGVRAAPVVGEDTVTFAYLGLDDVERRTQLRFELRPDAIDESAARYEFELEPHEQTECCFSVACDVGETPPVSRFPEAREGWRAEHRSFYQHRCNLHTSNESFNEWIEQSKSDLFMMLTRTPQGYYPYAGIPWFSTVFGRDGIFAAMHTLWLYPDIARGVLAYLAAHQATEVNAFQDCEPGKILHEQREGEMAALGEVPFGNYFGSVDATPLFVALAGQHFERTNDVEFMRRLWPHIERALEWMDRYGDVDGDGFIEYERHTESGLVHQGWKDSIDSVFHADDSDPEAPIALCEVQAYAYEAKIRAAAIADALNHADRAQALRREAQTLRNKFQEAFWCDDLKTYVLALDGLKRPCKVRASNAGQCLLFGIASDEHAAELARQLVQEPYFSGWGVRTLADGEPRFNPVSYHNGSIWPHDNALIAAGLARYGYKKEAMKILKALFEASRFFELKRMPELFCGFRRRQGEGPTLYPVACHPQTWAATSVYYILQACLGLTFDIPNRRVIFNNPALPDFLRHVTVENFQVTDAIVDLTLNRHPNDVSFNVTRKTRDDLEIVIIK